MKAVVIRK